MRGKNVLLPGLILLFGLLACNDNPGNAEVAEMKTAPEIQPLGYVCYRTTSPVNIDGIPDEKDWSSVPWTDYFVDIEGSVKPAPRFNTRAKMLWDNANLYIVAELEEPHIWATLKQRDTIIFFDHDFEVFVDPDGDAQVYYELEVNAFGTPWDLLLLKPYRDGYQPAEFGWDIAGLEVGINIDGTINNPADVDKSWTVELKIPMISLLKEWPEPRILPKDGDYWRVNFSRVEWRTIIENGVYKKEINPETGKPFPEGNWVWSPQGRINMHMPEMWGYLQFSEIPAGGGTQDFIPDPDLALRWALWKIYYAESDYYAKNGKYTSSLAEAGLSMADFPDGFPEPVIETTRTTFESYFPEEGKKPGLTIYHYGRIVNLSNGRIKK
jgi:hypothetical protein